MKMKRLFSIILASLIIFSLTSCGNGWKSESHKELSFNVRSDWKKDDDRTANMANYTKQVSKDSSQVAVQLRVSRDDFFSEKKGTLEELANSTRDSQLKAKENAALTKFEPCTISDLPAYELWLTYDGLFNDKMEERTILIQKPDGIYMLTLEGSSDYDGDFAADYEELKSSLK